MFLKYDDILLNLLELELTLQRDTTIPGDFVQLSRC